LYVNEACDCHWSPQAYEKRWLLTDFGFSTVARERAVSRNRRGTEGYSAPELLRENYDDEGKQQPGEFSRKTDIWAIGCIIYRLATTGNAGPFTDSEVKKLANGTGDCRVRAIGEKDNWSLQRQRFCPRKRCKLSFCEELNSIICSCLEVSPDKRPTAMQLKIQFEEIKAHLMDDMTDDEKDIWLEQC
jgi:serine/threonine protein kinase